MTAFHDNVKFPFTTLTPTEPGTASSVAVNSLELPLVLVRRDRAFDDRLEKNRQLSPERRARRLLSQIEKDTTGA